MSDKIDNISNFLNGDRHAAVKALHDIMQDAPCNSLYSLAEAVLNAGYAKPVHPILKVLNDPQVMELVALKATVAQQAQMIEWLQDAGKVEPVAFWYWPKDCQSDKAFTTNHQLPKDFYEVVPLYTSPPAPVAVVLPERLTSAELEELEVIEVLLRGQGLSNLAGTMAAARQFIDEVTGLDKVKELNQ